MHAEYDSVHTETETSVEFVPSKKVGKLSNSDKSTTELDPLLSEVDTSCTEIYLIASS